jgi:hypothetical protein
MTPRRQRKITAEALRNLEPAKVKKLFDELGPIKTEELKHDWNFWARDNQLAPEDENVVLSVSLL